MSRPHLPSAQLRSASAWWGFKVRICIESAPTLVPDTFSRDGLDARSYYLVELDWVHQIPLGFLPVDGPIGNRFGQNLGHAVRGCADTEVPVVTVRQSRRSVVFVPQGYRNVDSCPEVAKSRWRRCKFAPLFSTRHRRGLRQPSYSIEGLVQSCQYQTPST